MWCVMHVTATYEVVHSNTLLTGVTPLPVQSAFLPQLPVTSACYESVGLSVVGPTLYY
jgi:hypothetical protein